MASGSCGTRDRPYTPPLPGRPDPTQGAERMLRAPTSIQIFYWGSSPPATENIASDRCLCFAKWGLKEKAPGWGGHGDAGMNFVASSARKEGHLMWPSSCAGLSEQQSSSPRHRVRFSREQTDIGRDLTASYWDRHRHRKARTRLVGTCAGRPRRSWRRCRCRR